MHQHKLLFAGLAVCMSWSLPAAAADPLPAFPGAEGFGAHTPGGRGGQVLFVTNLDDYIPGRELTVPGSLRAACDAQGKRFILFRVSGDIRLKAPLVIREPNVTIAGQTAPGDGICIRGQEVSIRTHDVVIRHLRFRPGDEAGPARKGQGRSFEPDGLSIGSPSRNVIIDHCSVSWAIDECLSVSGAGITDVTVQWCIISESLNDSFHSKGRHGYGSLLRTNGSVTFHHNLYAHHSSRSPRPGTYGEGSILLDFRNNVIYDSFGYSAADPVRMNYVGNYIQRPRRDHAFSIGGETTQIYAEGNLLAEHPDRGQWSLIARHREIHRMSEPFPTAPVATHSAREAYELILEQCGATLPRRDAVDRRVMQQLRDGTGSLIDSQSEVGGWPELTSAEPPQDSDGDGMPDDWERHNGLDPHDPRDAHLDLNGDGYTNLEAILNGTDPRAANRSRG